MTARRLHAAIAVVAVAAAAGWPLSTALTAQDALQARLFSGILVVVVCVGIASTQRIGPLVWTIVSLVAAVSGIGLLVAHLDAAGTCAAEYDARLVVIGRTLTPLGSGHLAKNPGYSAADLLIDAGGEASRVWTTGSIGACRLWLGAGVMALPLFAAAVSAAIARRRFLPSADAALAAHPAALAPGTFLYDAFLSYRHTEPDRTHALTLLEDLEARGFRVAVDIRDFRPNEHFLTEMERCIKQSRFVLCVVTARYLESDHTSEEAIISKTIDMAERRKRIVPLIVERVALPVWLHGLVGIDWTDAAAVDPLERLTALLRQGRVASDG